MSALPVNGSVFPFIVSCGRSGSTLLRSMFDSHPEIAVPGESYFITKLMPRRPLYEQTGFDAARFIDDVVTLNWTHRVDEPTWVDRWGIDRDVLRDCVLAAEPRSYAEAVRRVFRCYADWRGKRIYGDKTPAYIASIDEIGDLLPESRFVHLVRDGRNVALAFRSAAFGPRSIEENALHWKSRTMAGRTSGLRLGPDRYLEVKYEDLVRDPEASLRRVCEWLGVPFDVRMLDHTESAKGILLGFEQAHANVVSKKVQKGLRDWRKQMSAREADRFEIVAADALEAFGYERSNRAPGIGARAQVGVRLPILAAKKVYRRARGLSSATWW